MRHRRAPRGLGGALSGLVESVAPQTPLSRIQRVWPDAVGPLVAGHATPTAVADGTLVVTCDSAVWAQELDLLQADLLPRLAAAEPAVSLRTLRCRAAASGAWARGAAKP